MFKVFLGGSGGSSTWLQTLWGLQKLSFIGSHDRYEVVHLLLLQSPLVLAQPCSMWSWDGFSRFRMDSGWFKVVVLGGSEVVLSGSGSFGDSTWF